MSNLIGQQPVLNLKPSVDSMLSDSPILSQWFDAKFQVEVLPPAAAIASMNNFWRCALASLPMDTTGMRLLLDDTLTQTEWLIMFRMRLSPALKQLPVKFWQLQAVC